MSVGRYNNEFGEWLKGVFAQHGVTSTRQARIRTGLAHTTLEDALHGRQPSVETTIRIASGFKEDVGKALRLAGHAEMAELWETGAAPLRREEEPDSNRDEPMDEEEGEILLFYRGVPEPLKPAARRLLKSLMEEEADTDLPTFGKGRKARG